MPLTYSIVPEKDLAMVRASGRIEGPEIVSVSEQMYTDLHWQSGFDQVFDYRDVTGAAISPDDLQAMFALLKRFDDRIGSSGKQALIAEDEMHHALCRLYEVTARSVNSSRQIRTFRTIEDADVWIGKQVLVKV